VHVAAPLFTAGLAAGSLTLGGGDSRTASEASIEEIPEENSASNNNPC
jgi:hypothetical protein